MSIGSLMILLTALWIASKGVTAYIENHRRKNG